ncbi:hypothetical protein BDP55DRAFT_652541 [Colletotrichum godetiae]|uniref:Hydrophobin n=1 Tax=Colletotrichum godetiae TaxID=1209918 RepID=A0AAJ0EXM1_9PEZI|nr:uncharacterized protein BDP55DRAFT_652541 [Colletotrichum godetiae]KAK1690055.1 hypothetical protein BDP55DRAFT_652541 [Colletotrichum godetiae]
MKFTAIIAAVFTIALSVKAADRVQCAGTVDTAPNRGRYEPSGSLTANLTQVACKSGNIDGALKGNQKCCISNDKGAFGAACTAAKFPPQFASGFKATFQPC